MNDSTSQNAKSILDNRNNNDIHELLPNRNTQSGSPMNTFTISELQEIRNSLPILGKSNVLPPRSKSNQVPNFNILKDNWTANNEKKDDTSNDNDDVEAESKKRENNTAPDWYGLPHCHNVNTNITEEFRLRVRNGEFTGTTNGVCPGFMQCNLVVLKQGQEAFDFLLFCQRNKKSCPLIEVCDTGSPFTLVTANGADLRTDIPRYCLYKNGKLWKEVTDVTEYWPEDSVAFLIGCSFSYDGALLDAGIRLRSVEQKKNVPMYKTNLKCQPAGSLRGNMVVSMKPIKALNIAKEVEITSKYPHAHGGPVCVGCPDAIGVTDIHNPDFGDAVDILPDEVPVFHACGVTPQSVLMDSKVSFAITHSAGHMFITDLPSDTVL